MSSDNKSIKKYPPKKQLLYQQLQKLPKEYNVIALSRMEKVRATQLMAIRKKFHDEINIKIIKNKVAQRAFEKIENFSGIKDLSRQLEGQCALMFTNISPFKINLIFDQNKVFLSAKGGDIASKEIVIPSGNTGIPPGPVLSEFKEANVQTKIDQGSISVNKDTVVAKPGDVISQKLASLLSKLDIKPIEAGISVNYALSDGLQFNESDLKLDIDEYKADVQNDHFAAINFATTLGYPSSETINTIFSLANQNSIKLAIESGYVSKDSVEHVLNKAQNSANILISILSDRGYTNK